MAEVLSNGVANQKDLKSTFGTIKVYDFERTTNGSKNGSREVYKVTDKRSIPNNVTVTDLNVGVFPTERFYFIFPWNTCLSNGVLDFAKLNGLMEIAHGQRSQGILERNPFEPPAGTWNIHWVCPHGSIANGYVNAKTLVSRIFGTSKIDTKTSQNIEHCYYDKDILTTYNNECQAKSEKFNTLLKYVNGTISNRDKIMNYELDKFNTGDEFRTHFDNAVGLVQCSQNIGMIITRNRQLKNTNLEEMLKSISKWGFPHNLVFSSCRYIEPEKVWKESNNQGPMAITVLGGTTQVNMNGSPNALKNKKVV